MNLEELKESLVKDGGKVLPLRSPLVRSIGITLLLILFSLLIAFLDGFKPHLPALLSSGAYLTQLASLSALGAFSTYCTLKESIPGETNLARDRAFLLVGITILSVVFVLLSSFEESTENVAEPEYMCALAVCVLSAILPPLLIYALRKGLFLNHGWITFSAALSCATFAPFSLHLVCARSSAIHLVLFHLFPAISLALIAALAVSAISRR